MARGAQRLTESTGRGQGSPRWSPDNKRIAFDSQGADGQRDIFVIDAAGGQPQRLTSYPSNEIRPSWSRDGKWIYFQSRRTGRPEVWRMPSTGGEGVQLTTTGGGNPIESRDGKTLYYQRNDVVLAKPLAGGPEQTGPGRRPRPGLLSGGQRPLLHRRDGSTSALAGVEIPRSRHGQDRSAEQIPIARRTKPRACRRTGRRSCMPGSNRQAAKISCSSRISADRHPFSKGVVDPDDRRQAPEPRLVERHQHAGRHQEVPHRVEPDSNRSERQVQVARTRLELLEVERLRARAPLIDEGLARDLEPPGAAERAAERRRRQS